MSIPAPPPRDRRQTRYPVAMLRLAREMYGDGESWTVGQITRYLAERYDPAPHENTVRGWVMSGYAERQRRHNIESSRRARNGDTTRLTAGELSDAELGRTLLKLRRVGLTYAAIAQVIRVYHDRVMSADTIRARCRRLGAAPKPHGAAYRATGGS